MIKSELSNGRASPVSDTSVRPGKKGAQPSLGSLTSAGSHFDPISVTKDLGQGLLTALLLTRTQILQEAKRGWKIQRKTTCPVTSQCG